MKKSSLTKKNGKIYKIGLLSPSGLGNLGDAAIQDAVIQNIKKRLPTAELFGITLNPEDTRKRHGIPAFTMSGFSTLSGYMVINPKSNIKNAAKKKEEEENLEEPDEEDWKKSLKNWAKGKFRASPLVYIFLKVIYRTIFWVSNIFKEAIHLIKSYRFLRSFDLLIVSGSGQLDDFWGGPWGKPYALFRWAIIAKMAQTKFIFLSVGTSALDSGVSRFFVRNALALADYRSFRDEGSKNLLKEIESIAGDPIYPDLAFSLPSDTSLQPMSELKQFTVVGINPIPYRSPSIWPSPDAEVYRRYIKKVAHLASSLIRERYIVLFLTSDYADRLVVKDVKNILREDRSLDLDKYTLEPRISTVKDLLQQIAITDMVVASRLHAALLSLLSGKPVMAISYDRKVDVLMQDMGLMSYCTHVNDLEIQEMLKVFNLMKGARDDIRNEIKSKLSNYKKLLDSQYDSLFGTGT